MVDIDKDIKNKIVISNGEENILITLLDLVGVDKCNEYLKNYLSITKKEKASLQEFYNYIDYEYELSSILFSMLRIQEDLVKGFLANCFPTTKINIEERESRYSKVKYYLKFPDLTNGGFIDIRTFNYTKGPITYYNAIKYLDFGDVNLVMSHLSKDYLNKFSNNKNIISDLDKTRKIRNYVYHHNTLFSYGKSNLKKAIMLVLRNMPTDIGKEYYINQIKELRYKGRDRDDDIGEALAIDFTELELKDIFSIKPRFTKFDTK